MSVLNELTHYFIAVEQSTSKYPVPLPDIYPHYVNYTRFLIEDKLNIKLTLEETQKYLIEEGMMPADEMELLKKKANGKDHKRQPGI